MWAYELFEFCLMPMALPSHTAVLPEMSWFEFCLMPMALPMLYIDEFRPDQVSMGLKSPPSPSSPYRYTGDVVQLSSVEVAFPPPPFLMTIPPGVRQNAGHQLSCHPVGWRVLVLADPGLLRREAFTL